MNGEKKCVKGFIEKKRTSLKPHNEKSKSLSLFDDDIFQCMVTWNPSLFSPHVALLVEVKSKKRNVAKQKRSREIGEEEASNRQAYWVGWS